MLDAMRRSWIQSAFVVASLLLGCVSPQLVSAPSASDPSQVTAEARTAPQLRLDTNAHVGNVSALDFSDDGQRLYSGGEDKVVRVWDVEEGVSIRKLRIPIGPDFEGKIYTLDVSPDERWLAVGGCQGCLGFWDRSDSHLIHVIDIETGEVAAVGEGHTAPVLSVQFSPDGKWLASGGFDRALHLWRVLDGGELWEEEVLTGHAGAILDLAWLPDGNGVISAGADGLLVFWDRHPAGGWYARRTTAGQTSAVNSVAVSSDGMWVASGSGDGSVRLWDRASGEQLRILVQKDSVSVFEVAFDAADSIVAYGTGGGSWSETGLGTVSTPDGVEHTFKNTIQSVLTFVWRPVSNWIAVSDGHFGTISIYEAGALSFRDRLGLGETPGPIYALGSSDRYVAWRQKKDDGPYQFTIDMLPFTLGPPPNPESTFHIGADNGPKASLDHADEGILTVYPVGRTERLQMQLSSVRLTTFSVMNARAIAVGSEHDLMLIDPLGKWRRECYGHEGMLQMLAPYDGGRILISGSSDQTLRFWNTETCELLISFFRARSGEWIAWTPQGYFKASENGETLVGVHVNRGPRATPSFEPVDNFPQLRRPQVVERVLGIGSVAETLESIEGGNGGC
jgi:WD40 repeat protein